MKKFVLPTLPIRLMFCSVGKCLTTYQYLILFFLCLSEPLTGTTFVISPKYHFSSDGGKKVCDSSSETPIKSHPSSQSNPSSDEPPDSVKLKECRPVEINPCKPTPYGIPRVSTIYFLTCNIKFPFK